MSQIDPFAKLPENCIFVAKIRNQDRNCLIAKHRESYWLVSTTIVPGELGNKKRELPLKIKISTQDIATVYANAVFGELPDESMLKLVRCLESDKNDLECIIEILGSEPQQPNEA